MTGQDMGWHRLSPESRLAPLPAIPLPHHLNLTYLNRCRPGPCRTGLNAKKQVGSGPTCLTRQVLVSPHRPSQACDSTNKVPTRKSQAQRPAPSTHSPTIDSTQINAPIHTSIPYPVTAKNEVCPVFDLVPATCCDSDAARERRAEAGQTFGCRLHVTWFVGRQMWYNVVTCSPQ